MKCSNSWLPHGISWVSLVAQTLKNPPTMRETWVQSLGWEDPLEKGTTTHSNILAWRISWTGAWQSTVRGSQRVRQDWATFTFTVLVIGIIFIKPDFISSLANLVGIFYHVNHTLSVCIPIYSIYLLFIYHSSSIVWGCDNTSHFNFQINQVSLVLYEPIYLLPLCLAVRNSS